jgi:alkylation response protein AidB-like acyl-CoA dehydrogenase
MNFTLTDEQRRMQDALIEFLEPEGGIELARHWMDGEDIVDDLWADLAGMDYTTLIVPAEHHGIGEGLVYLSAVLEEAGKVAMPGPYPETMAFAVPLIENLGTAAKKATLEAVAAGDLTFSFALYGNADETLPASIQLDAARTDDGFRLDGTQTLSPYGDSVEKLIVAARTREAGGYDGISLFLVDSSDVETEQLDSLGRTRPMARVQYDDVSIPADTLLGSLHEGGDALVRAIEAYSVAICAMLVGAARRSVDLSVEYANEREQFGKPIGHFQAIKHRIANMWIDAQHARSLVYYAAGAIANGDPSAARAASAATSFCGERMPPLFRDTMWNHGATGFTWDFDGHLYLKQAKSWENFLGSKQSHRKRIATERGI